MKIIIDRAIPFIESLFEPYAEVVYLNGVEMDAASVRDADALIIRTRTRCDEALLSGSRVRVIATATIGCDHIDMEYCRRRAIEVRSAAGCNARGVLQWVAASLAHLSRLDGWQPRGLTIGVVGVGDVGGLVAKYCEAWGFRVLRCDPPRAERESGFISLEELLSQVDIVTFHTSLNESSYHLLNRCNINLLRPDCVVLNSSRGECVESEAYVVSGGRRLAIDVWEGEPNIDRQVLKRATIATPHIAGYSLQGKANGTAMAVESVARALNLPITGWYPDVERNGGEMISWEQMMATIGGYFDIERDSEELKSSVERFEYLRNNYDYRREYF